MLNNIYGNVDMPANDHGIKFPLNTARYLYRSSLNYHVYYVDKKKKVKKLEKSQKPCQVKIDIFLKNCVNL